MFKDELYLHLSKEVYSDEYKVVDGYEQLIIPNVTNENGYFIKDNFVCAAYKKGKKVIISFRGTDGDNDYREDLNIALGKIPENSYLHAREFYAEIERAFEGQDVEIEFTGHSLGGAIAQLMGAKFGHKTVTFNAPG